MNHHLMNECRSKKLFFKEHNNNLLSQSDTVLLQPNLPKQNRLAIPTLTSVEKHKLDILGANICYSNGLPLSLFDSDQMKEFLHQLNPAYKPPCRKAVSGPLLDEVYSHLKAEVEMTLASIHQFNIITDESTNINGSRIMNLTIHTNTGSLHWISEDIGAKQLTAEEIVKWIKLQLQLITNNNLQHVNSIATDTCSAMQKMWNELHNTSELQHCFTIPYDSHGLQLLIKDLFLLKPFKSILHGAQF